MLRRADVRANTTTARTLPGVVQLGVPLKLTINVLDAGNGCKPLNGVAVDIWHANAHGVYSDETAQQAGGGTTGGDTSGQNFLRGYQITGKDSGLNGSAVAGQVGFKTIWPGWYTGRAIHIHVRVRTLSSRGATIAGYTTQIFFSDADNDRVLTRAARIALAFHKRTRPRTKTTASCVAPMTRRTSSRSPGAPARGSRRRSTSRWTSRR